MERVKVQRVGACRSATAAACSPRRCCASARRCPSRRRAGSTIPRCARTSSSACSRTGGCARSSPAASRVGRLVAFHTAHKLQLLAHSTEAYRAPRPARRGCASAIERAELRERYETDFMAALAERATPRRHVNVLQHCLGYFKRRASTRTRAGARRAGRRLPARPRAARRAGDADPAPRAPARRRVPGRPGLPRAASEGADAPQPRLGQGASSAERAVAEQGERARREHQMPRRGDRSHAQV